MNKHALILPLLFATALLLILAGCIATPTSEQHLERLGRNNIKSTSSKSPTDPARWTGTTKITLGPTSHDPR